MRLLEGVLFVTLPKSQITHIARLIAELDQDRAWLLEQIDKGRWTDLRLDLAAFERELGRFLIRASEKLEEVDPT